KARLPLLDKWSQGYPQSEFGDNRQEIYLITYSQLGDCRKAFDASASILKTRPNHERSVAVILGCVQSFMPPSAADYDTADKTATYALANLDTIYADANKGSGFAMTKDATKGSALFVLGWIPYNKQDWPKAETELTKALQAAPNRADISNMLATALVRQNTQANPNP